MRLIRWWCDLSWETQDGIVLSIVWSAIWGSVLVVVIIGLSGM